MTRHMCDPGAQPSPAPERSRQPTPAILAILVATCYASVLATYGFADDFSILDGAVRRVSAVRDHVIACGRPSYALLLDVSFRWAGTIERLVWIRAAGVAGIALLCWVVYAQLSRRGWGSLEAASISLVMVTMPAFRLSAFWAAAAAFPYAALLGGAAFLVVERSSRFERRGRRAAAYACAYALLLLALSIYQPAAMFFWAMAAIVAFSPVSPPLPRLLVRAGAVFAAGALSALALARLGSALFPVLPASRTALSLEIGAKLLWFVRTALVDVLHFVVPGHSTAVAAVTGVLLVAGLVLHLVKERRSLALVLVAAPGLLLASYTPNLAAVESWSSYRTQVALGSVAVVLAAVAIRGFARALAGKRAGAVTRGALGVTAAASLVLAARYTSVSLVEPAITELRWIRAQLASDRVVRHDRVRVIAAHWYDSISPEIHYDEVGIPLLARAWAAEATVAAVLREAGLEDVTVEAVEPDPEPEPAPPGTLIVDGRALRALR